MINTWVFAHPCDQHAVTCLKNVLQLNTRWDKKLGFHLLHRQPPWKINFKDPLFLTVWYYEYHFWFALRRLRLLFASVLWSIPDKCYGKRPFSRCGCNICLHLSCKRSLDIQGHIFWCAYLFLVYSLRG